MPPSRILTASPRAVPVVTTTVFAGGASPTALSGSGSSSGSSSLPIAAIVGGLVGGVFLALAVVGLWVWWGKSLEKQSRKQPRLRSALKKDGTPGMNASKHSLPRHHPAMVSQKSVSFAPVPSVTRTSEDSDSRKTFSSATEDTPRTALREQPTPASPANGDTPPPRHPHSSSPPRSALRGPNMDRAYAPARPSPLAHAARPPSSTDTHLVDDAPQEGLAPPRQLSVHPADRLSGVSAPSEYSQEGTASEVEPPFRMLRAPDGRLYSHRETDEVSRAAG